MRVLIVEDEPYMPEAIRDGLRLEEIAADIAGDGDTALELLSVNAYDIAVLDRDIPGLSGDEIAKRIVASGGGMPILMLTAADRLDDKASGFELGSDDYLTKPFELNELALRLRALDRRRGHNRPPVREIAGLRLDPFRREVYRDGRNVGDLVSPPRVEHRDIHALTAEQAQKLIEACQNDRLGALYVPRPLDRHASGRAARPPLARR
jgi:two-component system response regulator VanR